MKKPHCDDWPWASKKTNETHGTLSAVTVSLTESEISAAKPGALLQYVGFAINRRRLAAVDKLLPICGPLSLNF